MLYDIRSVTPEKLKEIEREMGEVLLRNLGKRVDRSSQEERAIGPTSRSRAHAALCAWRKVPEHNSLLEVRSFIRELFKARHSDEHQAFRVLGKMVQSEFNKKVSAKYPKRFPHWKSRYVHIEPVSLARKSESAYSIALSTQHESFKTSKTYEIPEGGGLLAIRAAARDFAKIFIGIVETTDK